MRSADIRIIARDLGLICALVGLMSVATLFVAIAWGERGMLVPFAVTSALSFVLAAGLYLPFRGGTEAHLKHGLVIAALGWLLVALLGAVPFFLVAQDLNSGAADVFLDYGNALFESMSGFTTTGLSLVTHPEMLPHTLQWWRSFLQWIGGIGVIVLVLGLMQSPIRPGRGLFFAERDAKIHPTVSATIRTMWWIYVLYTFMGIVLLWSVGMGIWDAINHSMTALSTGGFSTVSASMGHYTGWGVRLIILFLMVLGAMSFATHYDLLQGKKLDLRTNFYQARWLALFCAGVTLILLVQNMLAESPQSLASSAFQAVSAVSTTGFQTESLRSWSEASKLILILAMFVGGATGSTAGGIKVMRAVVLIRGIGWWLSKTISSPKKVLRFQVGNEKLAAEEADSRVQGAAVIFFAWLVCTLGGTLILMHFVPEGFTLADSLFEVVSAQSTVGLSVGITHAEMSVVAKLVLILNMWMGRLEVLPVLVMFRAIFRGLD
jgi:trk system potassium uptake protein TrkH